MTAPAPTARQTPSGIYLRDGYQTLITFSADPDILMYEIGVKTTGDDGGDPIDTTTMWNETYRTKSPRALITNDEIVVRAAYDPEFKNQIRAMLNVEQTITVNHPDDSTEAVFGWVRKTEYSELVEGELPIVTVTIEVSNWDFVANVEAGPAVASTPGT